MKDLVPQKWKNTAEAAAHLGLSPGTLEVWRSLGRGPRYPLGPNRMTRRGRGLANRETAAL